MTRKRAAGGAETVEVRDVTPDDAKAWLGANHPRNRRLRPAKVAEYAADIRGWRWKLSDQAITFDARGKLVNGQHRLAAVVVAGVPIRAVVLRGVDPGTLYVLDGGMKRKTDDRFGMAGRDWPAGCGATVRRVRMGGRTAGHGQGMSDPAVAEFMGRHATAVALAHDCLPAGPGKPFGSASIRAVLVRAAIGGHPEKSLRRFAAVVTTGLSESRAESAAVLLRNAVLDAHARQATGGGTFRGVLYQLAGSALRAFLDGKKVTELEPAGGELFPIPGDEPEGVA